MIPYQVLLDNVKDECEDADWQGAADKLNAYDVEVQNKSRWTYAKLEAMLTFAGYVAVVRTMKGAVDSGKAEILPAITAMSDPEKGIELWQPERQALIDALADAGGWTPQLRLALKEAGVEHRNLVGGKLTAPLEVPASEVETSWAQGRFMHTYETQRDLINAQAITYNVASTVSALRTAADTLESL